MRNDLTLPDEQLEDLLDRWDDARSGGTAFSLEELREQCRSPELLEHFERGAKASRAVDRLFPLDNQTETVTYEPPPGDLTQHDQPDDLDIRYRIADLGSMTDAPRGGCGLVLIGEDSQFSRGVAVKMSRFRRDDRLIRREADLTAKLDHPGVVPIYAVGLADDGRPFYVMRRVNGTDLSRLIQEYHQYLKDPNGTPRKARMKFRVLLTHFASMCRTIAYAHSKGVVHRDIKPANVMIGKYGEATVIDWGIAAEYELPGDPADSSTRMVQLQDPPELKEYLKMFRTNGYASPEQVAGEAADPSGDVYSLGVTLAEILTGESPTTRTEKSFRGQPPALVAICLKAMSESPNDRYPDPLTRKASALELAKEVERYLAFERVKADDESPLRRLNRIGRRNPGLAVLTACLAALMIAGCFLLVGFNRIANEREDFRRQAAQAQARQVAHDAATEIDARWRVLEKAASDPDLIEQMKLTRELSDEKNGPGSKPGAEVVQDKLERWLYANAREYEKVSGARSWFICDRWGWQWMRHPVKDRTIGENYRSREYFKGAGTASSPGTIGVCAPHTTHVHFSKAYESSGDSIYKVALSCPIWGGKGTSDEQFLGVIGMSIEVNQFSVLNRSIDGTRQMVILADLRNGGQLLHHSGIRNLHIPKPDQKPLPSLPEGLLAQMEEFRDARWTELYRRQDSTGAWGDTSTASPTNNVIRDNDNEEILASAELAVFEPVYIHSRDPQKTPTEVNTGLVVIILDGTSQD